MDRHPPRLSPAGRHLAEVPFVEQQHQLRHPSRRQHHQHAAGDDDIALFDAATDEDAVTRRDNAGTGQARSSGIEPGPRLGKFGLPADMVAAAGAGGLHLRRRGAGIAAGDLEIVASVVEKCPRRKALGGKRCCTTLDLRCTTLAGLRGLLRFARAGQSQFAQLAHMGLSLCHRTLRLDDPGGKFMRAEQDKQLTGLHRVAFPHRDIVHGSGHLAADFDTKRRFAMPAGDDGFDKITTSDQINRNTGAGKETIALPDCDRAYDDCRKQQPAVRSQPVPRHLRAAGGRLELRRCRRRRYRICAIDRPSFAIPS